MTRPPYEIPYDPSFLGDGYVVPMPGLTGRAAADALNGGRPIDYIHYSLVMNARRRMAVFTAHNVDASRLVKLSRKGLKWWLDERVGAHQLGPDVYTDNAWDRGHLVRRQDVVWGSLPRARDANGVTFSYTNAAPQHENFNQDEWVFLEDWVLENATDFSFRLCVFTGPVFSDDDRPLAAGDPILRSGLRGISDDVLIPSAFWKVVVLRDASAGGDDLSVVAFAMRQTAMWSDAHGSALLRLKVHQVTLRAIEQWTQLDFGDLKVADELEWSEAERLRRRAAPAGAWPEIRSGEDIVYSGPERRRTGLRVKPVSGGAPRLALRSTAAPRGAVAPSAAAPCGCGEETFDAQRAVRELGRTIGMLVDHVTGDAAPAADAAGGVSLESVSSLAALGGTAGAAARGARAFALSFAEPGSPAADLVARSAVRLPGPKADKLGRMIERIPRISILSRIVGGKKVPSGEFSDCVCLGNEDGWFCTGVLVRPRVVLTAAHCEPENITRVLLRSTMLPPFNEGPVRAVADVVPHPDYDPARDRHDLCVVLLAQDAGVAPIPLATDQELDVSESVTLVGFGYNDPNLPLGFGTKRHVNVPLGPIKDKPEEDFSELEARLGYVAEFEFVAGRKGLGRDSCNGDSGGPAYVRVGSEWKLGGITSRATAEAHDRCGDGGIYVRPWVYRDWIESVIAVA